MDNVDVDLDTTDELARDEIGVPPRDGDSDIGVGADTDTTGASSTARGALDRWLPILLSVTEAALSHLDLQELLREILARVREGMGVDNAAVLLVNADKTHLTVYAARGPEEEVAGKVQVRLGHGVAGTIASNRQPMIIDDLRQVEVENPLLRATVRSLVGAPLLAGDELLGVIHVDSVRRSHFKTEDLQLLQIIADRVAMAIKHAQLYDAERATRREAEASAQKLRALQAIGDVALEHTKVDDMLHSLLPRIQDMLEVDNVAILLPTKDMSELTLYTVRGPEEAVLGKTHVPFGEGVAGTIAATRKPLVVGNLATVPVSNPFLREHFHSLLGVPLIADDQLIGVIHVDSARERRFTDEERQLLEALADRIASAIALAQRIEGTQRERDTAEREVMALQETTDRMDEFLSIASHELRTPLTSLNMNAQMLDFWLNSESVTREAERLPKDIMDILVKARPMIKRSRQNIRRLERLVGELLDVSRIREGRLEMQPQLVDLETILRDVLDEHQQAHPACVMRLEEMHASKPMFVQADPDRIRQVVSNFLSNALKYSKPGAPITVSAEVKRNRVRVSIRDEGPGIPNAELPRIWDRFYRVPGISHQTGSQVGLGLGLYICRDIVINHNGQVGVESQVGEGSVFWFSLPLASSQPVGG